MKRRFTILTAALALLVTLAIPMGVWGQAPVGTTLWGETWTGGDANETPSAYGFEGTTVYGGATLTYAQSSTNTKLYEEALAGGESPELLLSKSNQTWTISNIPTGQATGMALSFNSNKTTFDVTSTTTGITISGSQKSWTIASTSSVTTFNLTIKNTGSSNARIDDIVLSVTTAGGDTPQPTTYTVTYDCNGGTSGCPQNVTGIEPNTQIQLADAPSKDGFDFDGWSDGNTTYGENEDYTVTGNVTFTAQWTENTTPTPGGITATLNIQAYAEANSWTNGTQYTTATVAPVTFTANGGGNTGKYYESGHDWRFYQGESASITITVTEGYTLVSVTPTYSGSNNGVLKNGNATIASGTTVNVSGTSVTFTVGNSGSATNGQVRFTNIDVVYVSDGGTQTASDLTITNESTDLTFDLYNNTTAQVISYTTSSTGAITITPAESDYFSYVHDAAAKTITVTPTAVTPSAQTVTISQAADDDYYAGTATFTVSVANSDPNLPGTQNNPYTVAQARAAIDANSGTQGVYATGIVSAIPTAWSTQYNNITFNFVDNAGDTDFLQAYRCVSGTGVDASTVAVGDIVVVHGNLTKYGSTYEFGQGCELVSLTHPVVVDPTVTVTPNSINAPFAGAEGTLTLTYENIEEFISFDYYFCDANGDELEGEDPDWIYAEINEENDAYTLSYIIDANDGEARTAYMKVYTFDDNLEEVSAIVTVNQEEYVAPTYAELPFSFNDGKADIEETDGLYQEGLGSDYSSAPKLKFDGTGDWLLLQFNERPGTLTFVIKNNSFSGGTFKVQTSEDGVTYTDLETYTEITDTQNEEFTDLGENVRYIKWIYTEKVSGNVGLGNIALAEYIAPVLVASITVNPDEVNVDAEEHDGTLDLTYENLTITEMSDFDIQFCDANGDELSEEPDWIEVLVAEQDPEIGEGYVVSYYMVENEGPDARTAYFKVYAMDEETNFVYSNLVTISQAAPVAPVTGDKYVKVTSTDDLTSGQYLIVYEVGSVAFDGSLTTLDAASNTIGVVISDNEIAVNATTAASEFAIDVTAGTIKSASGFYIGQTSDANGMKTSTTEAYENAISIGEDGADIVSGGAYLRYNANSGQERFRYFKSSTYTGQKAIQLYKKVAEPVTETYTLTIEGYNDEQNPGGWYLIASPVTVDPATVEGLTEGDFDLYRFNQSAESEWENWKKQGNHYHFNLVPGEGYLYAHKIGGQFSLTGTPYSGNGQITLTKTDDANADFQGWNLVGNPFTENAYIDGGREFYTMQNDGSEILAATNNSIEAMEGVFVIADHAGETITFTTTAPTNNGKSIALNLSNDSKVIDRAIVRFGEGGQLPKFQLNKNHTKVYIPQDGKDYAVVRSEEMGEMPVSFKAENNGTFSLSVNGQNTEFAYLHLIDNLTGNDIDMLQTPSYSFEAKTTDYESRFKLVFATGDNSNEDNFAYFSNGSFVINNEGNATLQVIDIAGRIVKCENINGCANVNVNAAPGVYMLRLVNGDNVKTQKVVVK